MRRIAMLFLLVAVGCSGEDTQAQRDAGKNIGDYPCDIDAGAAQCHDFSLQAECISNEKARGPDSGFSCSIPCAVEGGAANCHASGGACYGIGSPSQLYCLPR